MIKGGAEHKGGKKGKSASTIHYSKKFHKSDVDFCVTGSDSKVIQDFPNLSIYPWYSAVASIIACDVLWGMWLVKSLISSYIHPPTLVRLDKQSVG